MHQTIYNFKRPTCSEMKACTGSSCFDTAYCVAISLAEQRACRAVSHFVYVDEEKCLHKDATVGNLFFH